MASIMGVQTFATQRNQRAEFLVDAILRFFADDLFKNQLIHSYTISSQKSHRSEIANDIWDHYLKLILPNNEEIRLWCQTTCYKGNKTKAREPNKTYEVRETLVEAISLRRDLSASGTNFRTLHFTVGAKDYTYGWFADMKEATFDLSLYIESQESVFSLLKTSLSSTRTAAERDTVLIDHLKRRTELGRAMTATLNSLMEWWKLKMPKNKLADQQSQLIKSSSEFNNSGGTLTLGLNIKGRVNDVVHSKSTSVSEEDLIIQTTKKVLLKNPFLVSAIDALLDWDKFCDDTFSTIVKVKDLSLALEKLWGLPKKSVIVVRRVLLRMHSDEGVNYVQDRDVTGITEHNLYSGDHSQIQIAEITKQIATDLSSNSIATVMEVEKVFRSRGKGIISQAKWFESKNGTALRPSFDYIQLFLENNGYTVVTPREAKIDLTGYQSEISSARVLAYQNLKVVRDRSGKNVGLLKAKFFSKAEFSRRCKEEAYVGLTLKHTYLLGKFKEKLGLPLVMFIDMEENTEPPKYALNCLEAFGWKPESNPEKILSLFSKT